MLMPNETKEMVINLVKSIKLDFRGISLKAEQMETYSNKTRKMWQICF